MNEAEIMRGSKEAQRARAAMKANFDEGSLANDLLLGHQIEAGKTEEEDAESGASRELEKVAEARLAELPGEIDAKKKELLALKVQSDILKAEHEANAKSMAGMKAKLQELGKNVDSSVLAEHETKQAAIIAERTRLRQEFEAGKVVLDDLNNEKMFHEAVQETRQ